MKHKKHKLNPSFFIEAEKKEFNKLLNENILYPFTFSMTIFLIMNLFNNFVSLTLIHYTFLIVSYVVVLILRKHIFHKKNQ